ncbi:MAG: LpqB family beta-propeller domain-containing protein, partial [Gordonia sp. (in: high G+C Gram-positive bacteria)]
VLSKEGQLLPATGDVVIPLMLARTGSSWRVSGDLPPGSFTDQAQFDAAYRSADLFFSDRTETRLVADPRWFFGSTITPTMLVSRLLAGPSPELAGAVGPNVGKGAQLHGAVSVSDDGQVSISLTGLEGDDARNRTVLAAEIVWTLESAGTSGTCLIRSDGSPLVADHQSGWRTADVKSFDPNPDTAAASVLYLVQDGRLVRASSAGLVPVRGQLGGVDDLKSAAVSPAQDRVAVVASRGDRQVLLQGKYGEDAAEVITGASISPPSFGADSDSGYAVVDGRPIRWVIGEQGQVRTVDLDVSAVTAVNPAPITSLKVSPDGARVALIVGGKLLLAVLSTNDRGMPSLTGVRMAAYTIDTPVYSAAWGGRSAVYVARAGDDGPVMRIPLSGAPAAALVSGNLKPPMRAIAATSSTVYAADSRGVLELGATSDAADQYWINIADSNAESLPVVPNS